MQQDPHPLAIIPVQKNILSSDTSSISSSSSSLSYGADGPSVNIRSLVPSSGAAPAAASDSALMRSLISVLPHEQADSQVRKHGCCLVLQQMLTLPFVAGINE